MISLKEPLDLAGYSVLVPSIGVGNVAQLAVDLIIATLKMKRVGSGYHNACLPIMGPPAYHHDDTKTVSIEVYSDSTKKLVIFQFRSPLVSVYINDFHKDLLQFIKDSKIKNVYILSSSHAYEKHNVNSPIFEFLQNVAFKSQNQEQLDTFGWQEHSGKVIFGGGNALKLFETCTNLQVPAFLLFNYVSEGDNSIEASQLVVEVNKVLKLFDKSSNIKLTIPTSWKFLFGNDIPDLLF